PHTVVAAAQNQTTQLGSAMERTWVVLLEAAADGNGGRPLELTALEEVLGLLADWGPSALYAADRYALQLALAGAEPQAVLAEGVELWRSAAAQAALPPWPLVRAEVKTPDELEAELRAEQAPLLPPSMAVTVDAEALDAAYQTT